MDLDQATIDMKSNTVINDVMNANVSRTCQQQTNNEKDTPDVRQYKERIAKLENAVRISQQQSQQQSKDNEKRKTDNQNEEVASGINRFTIQSDEYHPENPKACKEFYRFNSWDLCKAFIEGMFDVKYTPPTNESVKGNLSKFEQVLMTLYWIENKTDFLLKLPRRILTFFGVDMVY
mmetsp:Transcript_1189/g.1307  ORF Transcript_1189/g.1307 Transcript_1189/m.1307 type:complete len:177 (-) Transcript_1189:162-692(-)